MRTLLIDNYDSYTYNLYQLIAEVNGREPVVVCNDNPDSERLDLHEFDNIVISPGPGHPGRAHDFGLCADVIARTRIPLLGVCLGHQGVVVSEQGDVGQAPQARHGHLSKVKHDGTDLFRGLPDVFTAVRYHSLCALEPLPESLEATAWSEDGVIMGTRHRDRPLWGLQFHPESVATECGRELLVNFRDITERRRGIPHGSGRRISGSDHTPAGTAAENKLEQEPTAQEKSPTELGKTHYRLRVHALDFVVDTEAVFTSLFSDSPNAFWLDSAHVEPGLARFSYLGDDSGPLGELVSYRVGSGHVAVSSTQGFSHEVPGTIFDYLERELARRNIETRELPFDFACGYVGYFGYELKEDCGSPNNHQSSTPDAQWIFTDRAVTVDHEQGRTYVLALEDGSPEGVSGAAKWAQAVIATLGVLRIEQNSGSHRAANSTGQNPAGSGSPAVEPWLVRDRDHYLDDVAACKSKLLDGESYEICLTNSARVPAVGGGFEFYQELRQRNPAPYGAYLHLGDMHIACSSPERFLRIDREQVVETKPIKGTVRRGETSEEDEVLRRELVTSTKTYAENLMIVDLLRNDLGRVCEVSSVHVPSLMATETYATVHQLVSTVRGRLREDVGAIDCVRACFPGGSMTGAPKLRTMEIIDSLETQARGVYSGAIGFLGCNGTADLNIVIRTAVLTNDQWHVGAGGAIVLDSDPVDEYEEMLLKAAATLRAHPVVGGVPNKEGSHIGA